MIGFLIRIFLTRQFWLMFLSSFTVVLMLALRQQMRDEIFTMARFHSERY